MTDEITAMEQPYELVSIRPANPPSGMEGSNWHQYVIAFEGSNTIRGYRQGNLGLVTSAVEEIIAQLNERNLGKRGRVQLPLGKKTRNL